MDIFDTVQPIPDHLFEAIDAMPSDLLRRSYLEVRALSDDEGDLSPEAMILALELRKAMADEINERVATGQPIFDYNS